MVSFVEDYRYEEGEGDTVVCVEGRGQVAHPASISVSSLTSGTASGRQLSRHKIQLPLSFPGELLVE